MIYFDNAATTQVCKEAATLMLQLCTEAYGNPSSLHRLGRDAEQYLEAARAILAVKLCALPREITFTSGATESNHLAILGALHNRRRKGSHIVTTEVEHPSVAALISHLEATGAAAVTRVPPRKDGLIHTADILAAVQPDTALVTVQQVNNETGNTADIAAIGTGLKRLDQDVLFHADCAQGFLKCPLNVHAAALDLASVSGHKVHAPKGIGALYTCKALKLAPQFYGGGQERGLRSGTENLPGAAAFGAAAETYTAAAVPSLNTYLRAQLTARFSARIISHEDALPHILSFSIKGGKSEVMIHMLEEQGIILSSGSACAKGKQSPVLAAMGFQKNVSDSVLRLSLSKSSTAAEADAFLEALAVTCRRLRLL